MNFAFSLSEDFNNFLRIPAYFLRKITCDIKISSERDFLKLTMRKFLST